MEIVQIMLLGKPGSGKSFLWEEILEPALQKANLPFEVREQSSLPHCGEQIDVDLTGWEI